MFPADFWMFDLVNFQLLGHCVVSAVASCHMPTNMHMTAFWRTVSDAWPIIQSLNPHHLFL